MGKRNGWMQVLCLAQGLSFGLAAAWADAPVPEDAAAWQYKLTPSYYATTHETAATDLNVRANRGPHAVWLGYYQQGSEFDQWRTGYEYTAQWSGLQLVPSMQLATHGFAGGSLNARIGDAVYGLLGFGRTNTREYYNLNFDPNDAITLGFGTRLVPDSDLSAFVVKDDRLHTGQTVGHLVWRYVPDDHQRWIIDVSRKHGRASADEPAVSGGALSLTYDYRHVFVHLVRDRKVNFSAEDQTRVSLGLRF